MKTMVGGRGMKSVDDEVIQMAEDWWNRNLVTGFLYSSYNTGGLRPQTSGKGHWDEESFEEAMFNKYYCGVHWSKK